MEKIKFQETGLLEGLEIDEKHIVSDIFAQAIEVEENLHSEEKPYTLAFIRRVYEINKIVYNNKKNINIDNLVSYIYDKIIFLHNLDFLKNSDFEAEFYELIAYDFLRGIK